jgi:beta-dihydromenaquinone-9 omega-hydroxylase
MSLATGPNTTDIQRCPFSGVALASDEARTPDPVAAPRAGGNAGLQTDPGIFYDPLSYAAYDHPYELYKILREKAPVYYNERRDLYVVSRYEDVRAGLRNHEQLSSALGNDMDGTHASYGAGNLIMVDAPRHSALRSAVRRVFLGREILAKEDGIRELARQLLADLRENGGGDFAQEVALPLAIGAATKMMGMATEDRGMLQEHLHRSMVRTVGEFGVPDDAAVSNQESEEHIAEVFGKRSEEVEAGGAASGTDAITQIILGMHNGKVEPGEQVGLAHLILSAAIDAPAALLTNLVATLDKFPAFQSRLAQEPLLIPAFVEETLRFDTPGQNLCRQTTAEIPIAGVTIPADSRVMFLLGSANRDDRVFSDPDFFDVTREFTAGNRIMTFGDGVHACLGEPLARLAGRILIEALLEGPEIRVVGFPERWAKQMVRGFAKLPVKFID